MIDRIAGALSNSTLTSLAQNTVSSVCIETTKYAKNTLGDRKASLSKVKSSKKFMNNGLREDLLTKETPETYDLIKGTVEAGSF